MEKIFQKLELLNQKLESIFLINKEYYSLEEAANYLMLSKSTLYKLTAANRITFYRPNGKRIVFKKDELHNWLETNIVKQIDRNYESQAE